MMGIWSSQASSTNRNVDELITRFFQCDSLIANSKCSSTLDLPIRQADVEPPYAAKITSRGFGCPRTLNFVRMSQLPTFLRPNNETFRRDYCSNKPIQISWRAPYQSMPKISPPSQLMAP